LFKLPGRYRGYTDEIDIRKDLMKMWRSLFLAIGFFIGLIGFECLFIEAAIFMQSSEVGTPDFQSLSTHIPVTISPPDWAPWVCMAFGTIVMIYSFTIPRRVRG
jgi:Na+-transporting NADH:ubiquinone oxidoreductase subunit NqrE